MSKQIASVQRWKIVTLSSSVSILATIGLLLALSGCASKQVRSYYADDYLQATERWQGTDNQAVINQGIQQFSDTLGDFTQSELRSKVERLYADQLYFNDTFKTFTNLSELAHYLEETGENVTSSQVRLLSHTIDGQDVYIRWLMDFAFSASGKDIQSRSLGMTHVRFNEQGEIILHQDFWDSTDGFFSHLPIVGGVVHRIRNKL